MKVTDAHWELRNLGITTQEVEIENSDSCEYLATEIDNLSATYRVIKSPAARLDIYKLLSEKGYHLAETAIRVSHSLKKLSCPELIMRFCNEVSFDNMDDKDFELMQEQIRKGMFKSDRVILDPYFNPSQAANRYIMWMQDERNRGTTMFNYRFNGEPVGFSCMKETKPGSFCPILGGIYNTDKALPIGTVIVYKQMEVAKSLGGKELFTHISTNNPAVVKIYSQLGYTFDDVRYVFVKHTDV